MGLLVRGWERGRLGGSEFRNLELGSWVLGVWAHRVVGNGGGLVV